MGHDVLQYIGGKISLEMQAPKLMWLKETLPETYNGAKYFMDLADYLTFRATGKTSRSVCTTTCKWNLVNGNWNDSFWNQIGLEDIPRDNYRRIGNVSEILTVGAGIGTIGNDFLVEMEGLLPENVVVASGMIDAHAGALAML